MRKASTPQIGGHTPNSERSPFDDYPTDARWVSALLKHLPDTWPRRIWEPAAGAGQLVEALRAGGYRVAASDIQAGDDFLAATPAYWQRECAIVTNPPYRLADEFVQHALKLSNFVAMLVPWQYLGGQKRTAAIFLPRPPTDVVLVCNRMVVHDKTSQFYHAWLIWTPGTTQTHLHWELV